MLRYICSLALLLFMMSSTPADATTPLDCSSVRVAQVHNNVDPCTWVRTGRVPNLTPYPYELMICIDYRKMTGVRGSVGMFALADFDPTNLAKLQIQLDRAVFNDHRQTDASGVWCRGRHWFKDAKWIVFCDEQGGIGWVTGESFEYARRHTWLPNRRPVVMGLSAPPTR